MAPDTVGYRIRLARQAAGMSQKALAAHMGITYAALATIELHDNDPRCSRIVAAAKALGVSCDYLLLGTPPEATPETAGLRTWLAHVGG